MLLLDLFQALLSKVPRELHQLIFFVWVTTIGRLKPNSCGYSITWKKVCCTYPQKWKKNMWHSNEPKNSFRSPLPFCFFLSSFYVPWAWNIGQLLINIVRARPWNKKKGWVTCIKEDCCCILKPCPCHWLFRIKQVLIRQRLWYIGAKKFSKGLLL